MATGIFPVFFSGFSQKPIKHKLPILVLIPKFLLYFSPLQSKLPEVLRRTTPPIAATTTIATMERKLPPPRQTAALAPPVLSFPLLEVVVEQAAVLLV